MNPAVRYEATPEDNEIRMWITELTDGADHQHGRVDREGARVWIETKAEELGIKKPSEDTVGAYRQYYLEVVRRLGAQKVAAGQSTGFVPAHRCFAPARGVAQKFRAPLCGAEQPAPVGGPNTPPRQVLGRPPRPRAPQPDRRRAKTFHALAARPRTPEKQVRRDQAPMPGAPRRKRRRGGR